MYCGRPECCTSGIGYQLSAISPEEGAEIASDPGGSGSTSYQFEFTPRLPGTHELRITILTADVPRVHVLITDPLKTDGKRMKGY